MRVLNDRKEEKEAAPVDIFALISHSLLISMGMATLVFSPLAVLFAHLRFQGPWPKVATLAGALLALLFLDASLPQVLITFVFALYVADGVSQEMDVFKLLTNSAAIALVAGVGCVVGMAAIQHVSVGTFWLKFVEGLIAQLQTSLILDRAIEWSVVKGVLLYEGPFLYLSTAILSVWVSIGMAAHFGWLKEGSKYSSSALRQLRFSKWLNLSFLVLFAATFATNSEARYFIGGVFRVVSAFMFIQGCICLSTLLQPKGIRQGVRTFVYLIALLLGFYAVVGMGVISPWFLKKRSGSKAVLPKKLEEQT